MPIQNMYNSNKLLTNQESQDNCCQVGAAIGGEGMFGFTPLYDNCCGLGVTVPGGRDAYVKYLELVDFVYSSLLTESLFGS